MSALEGMEGLPIALSSRKRSCRRRVTALFQCARILVSMRGQAAPPAKALFKASSTHCTSPGRKTCLASGNATANAAAVLRRQSGKHLRLKVSTLARCLYLWTQLTSMSTPSRSVKRMHCPPLPKTACLASLLLAKPNMLQQGICVRKDPETECPSYVSWP